MAGLSTCPWRLRVHRIEPGPPSFAFPHQIGSSSSLTIKHQTDVGAAYRPGHVADPYPTHYRPAFASSVLSIPHTHQPPLRLACHQRTSGGVQGSHVPLHERIGLGACCPPGSRGPRCAVLEPRSPLPYLLVQARQPLGLFSLTTVQTQVQMFSPYRLPNPSPGFGCQEGLSLAASSPQETLLRRIVPVALDSDR
jgi:hypothetical protein